MTSQPPPSRYRVEERDGRLITIDTVKGTESGHPPAPPGMMGMGQRSSLSARPAVSTGPRGDGLILALANAATGGRVDAQNRPILSTEKTFDPLGPRFVALDPAGYRRLGWVILGLLIAALMVLILAIVTDFFIALFVIAFALFRAGGPILTSVMKPVLERAVPVDE
jgi:hypothetical protein